MPSFLRPSNLTWPSLVGAALLSMLSACGSSPSCPAGSEKCPCYGNETCNTGLSCASGLCVNLGGQAALDAGSDAAATTSGLDSSAPTLSEVRDTVADVADSPLDMDTSISGIDSGLGRDGGVADSLDSAAADMPQVSGAVCGDGIKSSIEGCDDGNTTSGDGCSATCHIEVGWKCDGTPAKCSKTTCGDGKQEGSESCDDGNTMPFDGCSEDCQIEPKCTAGGGCTSQCGDGIVLGEECDDGNNLDGDGCSKDCTIEAGWTCSQPPIGDTMKVPVIYRDFRFHTPTDFEAGVSGSYNSVAGIVAVTLSAMGKPVYSGLTSAAVHIASTDTFSHWYTDVAGVNHSTATKMTLWNDGKGNYVNRYGANGEQWNITTSANWCGTVADAMLDNGGSPIPCTYRYQAGIDGGLTDGGLAVAMTDCQKMEAQGYTMLAGSCQADASGTYEARYIVGKADGNPLFFPVDNDTFTPKSEFTAATIPPCYDATASWPKDVDTDGKTRLHNFSFTSEIRYWFRYDKTKTYTLDFVGDDDMWVFVNGRLAADLGGIHIAVDGNVVIGSDGNATTTVTPTYPIYPRPTARTQAAALGLQDGKIYEIAIFQAERQSNASSLEVTLPPFTMSPSECTTL